MGAHGSNRDPPKPVTSAQPVAESAEDTVTRPGTEVETGS